MRLLDIVDHDIERSRGAFADRFVPFDDDQLGAAAQFKNTEILIAENATQAEGLEEFDGVIDRMGLDPDMTDGDGAGGCLWLAPVSAIWALILAFDIWHLENSCLPLIWRRYLRRQALSEKGQRPGLMAVGRSIRERR